ncbi:MAG: saccharopine dehydrogenase NADP-binding domain-containing protein [Parvibaculum sp.]|uniref:saccharopine dehydrogenase NADP-binding domain-containing protein n=1 Tax=Parvibaculum sp. TaxID=2024848 RepID=UPI00284251D2|nr:saccharopine dehydrogenase NADP-binding domain-containing protein [Parvibaculum sp.]MDR3497790.1 saccharopine dehydrogenase NADP-binding domain-containing protein [Parvibaculum sp.]
MKSRLLIYGVDEFEGALMSRRAAASGLAHIGAGREIAGVAAHANAQSKIHPGAVEPRTFGLGNPARIAAALDDVAVLVNASTPFVRTSPALVEACLATGTHYLDLSSEGRDVAALMAQDAAAASAGITVAPGACFDLALADAMAARLALLLPGATALTIAMKHGPLTRSEARALIAALRVPGETVRTGNTVAAMPASRTVDVDFGAGIEQAALAPWRGDGVVSRRRGPYTTIESYEVLPPALLRIVKGASLARYMFRRGWRLKALERRLARRREGPTDAELARARSAVWGEARTPEGRTKRARLETPAAPLYTADAALLLARALLDGKGAPGFRLPSEIGGGGLVQDIAGVVWRELADPSDTHAPDPSDARAV